MKQRMVGLLALLFALPMLATGCGALESLFTLRPTGEASTQSSARDGAGEDSQESAEAARQGEGESSPPEVRSEAQPQQSDDSDNDDQMLVLTLAVPEGYTLARIGMTLEEMGVCTAAEFVDAAQTGDYSDFPLVAQQAADSRRCFGLEGYLFPATYEFYNTESPQAIIRRMLTHTEQRIDAELRETIRQSGYTVDEVLALASIIEKEAFGREHMPGISSVLHNRLEIGMRLQCDVTITYVEGAIKPFISGDRDRYNEYYNTYKCDGLPAGAICNPGLDAIRAALSPATTDYLYFVTDADKNYYYAETWEGHLENVAAAGL